MKEKTADEVILTPMYEGEVYKYHECSNCEKERERIKINLKNNTIEKQEDMKNIAEYIDYLEQENAELKIQRDYYKREYSLYNKTLEEAGKALTKK